MPKNHERAYDWENFDRALYWSDHKYGFPKIDPVYSLPEDLSWISFNYARSTDKEDRKKHGLHFYIDDYQFKRLWTDPDRYIPLLQDFGAVMSTDFSMYTDFPVAMQIWNMYRDCWLANYWTEHGITVVPAPGWSDHASYDWCFDAYPEYSIVSVSSLGTQADPVSKVLFMDGYREMMDRLHPKEIIFYGIVPDGCYGNITHIDSFHEKMRARIGDVR